MGIQSIDITHPEVAKQWHPSKNGKLKSCNFTFGSSVKIWWKCPVGDDHEWILQICDRTRNGGSKCPFCLGRRLSYTNRLDIVDKTIAKEWHPTKNGKLKPSEFTRGQNKKVWWKCDAGIDHAWEETINNRTRKKSGCPFCSGRKLSVTNRLDLNHKRIAAQWHPTKNGKLKCSDVASGTERKVWWLCPLGDDHEWQATIYSRVKQGSNCPFCNGKKPSLSNRLDLAFPTLINEWHPIKNKLLKPKDFVAYSNKKVWWKCPSGDDHEWQAIIADRTSGRNSCPFCQNKKTSKSNRLDIKFPDIAKEWHPHKNKDLKPQDFVYGSNKKVWWKCSKNPKHSWQAGIVTRTTRGYRCPKCNPKSSMPELRVLAEMKMLFRNVKSRHRIGGKEVDIFIPSLNIGLEYDGSFYHSNKEDKDREKNYTLFDKEGVKILRLRESPLKKIEPYDVVVSNDFRKQHLNQLIQNLFKSLKKKLPKHIISYIEKSEFQNNAVFLELCESLPGPPKGSSLQDIFPEVALAWHKKLNHPLVPSEFFPHSSKKVWWQCPIDKNHTWEAVIGTRTGKLKSGCPTCAGKRLTDDNRLDILYPDIAREWHPTKNGSLEPKDFMIGSSKKVWWKCSKDISHEWEAAISQRTRSGSGCHLCWGRIPNEKNRLDLLYPKISAEWHPIKNGSKTPAMVSYGSELVAWWKCPEGDDHEWAAMVYNRTKLGSGCPFCSNRRTSTTNRLDLLFPQISSEWHESKNGTQKPADFVFGSTKRAWWICSFCDNEWEASISTRTKGAKCPTCKNKHF